MDKNRTAPTTNQMGFIYQPEQQHQQQQQQQYQHQQNQQQQHVQTMPPPPSYEQTIHQSIANPQPVVIIQHQAALPVGPDPTYYRCPRCHVQKLTRVQYEPSTRTHLMAALLCIFGLWCCACLPYCTSSCMNANHYCSNCNEFVGVYTNN